MVCTSAGAASAVFGFLCLLLSGGLIAQAIFFGLSFSPFPSLLLFSFLTVPSSFLFSIDAPFYYYTEEYFSRLLLAAKPMTIWCFAQGAFGITTALFCFVFPFACSRCGIPTVCPTRFSSLPYTALCVTSHLSPHRPSSSRWWHSFRRAP